MNERYRVRATLETPGCHVGPPRYGNVLETQHCLSGRSMRGALAAAILESGGSATDEGFRQLFIEGGMRCSDLRGEGSIPWPHSMVECKTHPGGIGHPRKDLLLAAAAQRSMPPECQCKAKFVLASGYARWYIGEGERAPRYHAQNPGILRTAHVQIDPAWGRAMTGQLFSAAVLHAQQVFFGSIAVSAGADYFKDWVLKIPAVWLGRGRTRGQGCTRLEWELCADPPSREDVLGRIRCMNHAATRWPALSAKVVFSCTLLSPAVLFNQWLLPVTCPGAGDFGVPLAEYEPLAGFGSQTHITGWHSAGRVPREETIAWSAGSVFLFGRDVPEDGREAEYEALADALFAAEEAGAGEFVEEGFGEIAFCHKIHVRQGLAD